MLGAELPGADGVALAFARRWIDALRALRDRVPCAALIERALERSGYAAALLFHPGGDVALANVRKLVRMADGRPGASLTGFVGWLAERGESGAREGEAALHTQGEDVVTLTTIHGAKGLEWPVVFLCDLDRDMPGGTNAPDVYFDAVDGVGVRLDDDEGERCGAYEVLRANAALRELAEEKRVWYVASTRARDRLVLCAMLPSADGAASSGKPTPARWLLDKVAVVGDELRYVGAGRAWCGPIVTTLRAAEPVEGASPPRWTGVEATAAVSALVLRRVADVAKVGSVSLHPSIDTSMDTARATSYVP